MARRDRWAGALLALALLTAGCAMNEEATPTGSTASEESTTPTSPESTAASSTDAAGDDDSPAEPIEPGEPLSSVLATSPGPLGWALPAGRWTSDAFIPPLTFETPIDLVLRSEAKAGVVLIDPDNPETRITITHVASTASPSGQGPPPRTADDLRQSIADNEGGELVAEYSPGTLPDGSTVDAFDVQVGDLSGTPIPSPCALGFECVNLGFSAGGTSIYAVDQARFRVYLTALVNGRLRVYVTGGDAPDSVWEVADQIVTSMEMGPVDVAAGEVVSLSSLGNRLTGIPAGTYRTMLGESMLQLDLPADETALSVVFAEDEMVIFTGASDETFLVLFWPRWLVRPGADQTRMFQDVYEPGDVIDTVPTSAEEFRVWLASVIDVTDVGEVTVNGTAVPLWGLEMDETQATDECGKHDDGELDLCQQLGYSDGSFHWQTVDLDDPEDPSDDGGWFYLEGPNIVGYGATDTEGDGPPMMEAFGPLFEAMTFTRAQ